MELPKLLEFPQDNNFWRIEWVDRPVLHHDDQARITVYLSRIREDYTKPLNNPSLFRDEDGNHYSKKIYMRIGYLPILKIGTVWRNGVLQPESDSQFDIATMSFSLNETEVVFLTNTDKFGHPHENEPLKYSKGITEEDYKLVNKQPNDEGILKGSSAVLLNDKGGFSQVIIPSIVIFQTCFISSFKAANYILFSKIENMIDPKESGLLADEPTTFKACLFQDFADPEVKMLSNLYVNSIARKELKKLKNNCIRQQSTRRDMTEEAVRIKVNFPFDNLTIKTKGKVLSYKSEINEKRYLVTQLSVVHADLPFNKIILDRKNNNQKGLNEEGDQEAYVRGQKQNTDNKHNKDYIAVNDDVSAFLNPIQFNFLSGLDSLPIEIVKEEKEVQRYKSAKLIQPKDDGDLVGVGKGNYTDTNVRGMAIDEDIEERAPVSLDYVLEMIKCLREANIDVKTVSASKKPFLDKGEIINQFFYIPAKRKLSWYKTEDKSRFRYFIVAEIYHKGAYSYIVDVEPKKGDVLSIALLRSKNGQKISQNDFIIFMRDVVQERSWPFNFKKYSYQDKWYVDKMNHDREGFDKSVVLKVLEKLYL